MVQFESCELHSNLVSLHSETTRKILLALFRLLWITFKSCIFAFWNNTKKTISPTAVVVNYIQILYLCILKQHPYHYSLWEAGCELHSNLVSLHSETTKKILLRKHCGLWITFKSCIFAFWNNVCLKGSDVLIVVNYIQILYLCILKQLVDYNGDIVSSCELHSNLVSLHSETTLSTIINNLF